MDDNDNDKDNGDSFTDTSNFIRQSSKYYTHKTSGKRLVALFVEWMLQLL